MAGPSWLAATFAAVVIGVACYTASRIAAASRWRRPTELDADGVHVLMGVAMAGTLVPRLSTLPAGVWEVLFSAAATWFAWQAARARRGAPASLWSCPHPVPHLVESIAMLYMLLAARASATVGTTPGVAMAGPGAARFSAIALVMALYVIGYVVWTGDRLTSLTPALAAVSAQGRADAVVAPPAPTRQPGAPRAQAAHPGPAGPPMLAPRLAACYKIAMGITMAYMLILMV